MNKARDAFRTISEAATELDLPQHVLRHWEDSFSAIRPMRRAGGRRYYRLHEIELLNGVRVLLHEQGFTTKGVQKIFSERGAAHVAELGRLDLEGKKAAAQARNERVILDRAQIEDLIARMEGLKAELAALRETL